MHQAPEAIRYVGIHTAPAGEDFPPHRDQFWELMYLRVGHIVCQQGETRHAMHPGTAILHPPGVVHADFATTAYTTYYLWIDVPAQTPWPCLCHDDERRSLERVCAAIVREWRERQPERERMLALLTGQLGVLLLRSMETPEEASGETALLAAERVMEAGFHEAQTVGDIARQVGVSVSSLHGHFVRLRGQTPMAALQAVRLRHALAQLHHSTHTLEVIASLCGYNSASHLSRHVKAATGESPGRLRHRNIQERQNGPRHDAGGRSVEEMSALGDLRP